MKWIIAVVGLVLLPLVSALSCDYDTNPYIRSDVPFVESKIYWSCHSENMTDYNCLSYVTESNRLFQVNPVDEGIKGVGIVDTFESKNKQVQVFFRTETNKIRPDVEYQFSVVCGNGTSHEQVTHNVTPIYRDLDATLNVAVNFKDNAMFVMWGFLTLLIVGSVVALIISRSGMNA